MAVEIKGMQEFRQMLMNLPEDLQREARSIVTAAAERTAAQARSKYREVATGDAMALADHVNVSVTDKKESIRATVWNQLWYSSWYEFGTQTRARKRGRGGTGAAPPRPTLIPIARRERRQMRDDLIAMVRGKGLEVRGA